MPKETLARFTLLPELELMGVHHSLASTTFTVEKSSQFARDPHQRCCESRLFSLLKFLRVHHQNSA